MAYSGAPATDTYVGRQDVVRLRIGDIAASPELDDASVQFCLTSSGDDTTDTDQPNVILPGALCAARMLKALFTHGAISKKLSELSIDKRERYKAVCTVIDELIEEQASLGEVFFGGLTESGNLDLDIEDDATQPAFRQGQNDFPGTGAFDDDRGRC